MIKTAVRHSSERWEQPSEVALTGSERVNILAVDDLPQNRVVYESILEPLGHHLFIVGSGEEALKLLLKHEFAVILLDVNMPGMDGFETALLIRNRKKSARTPIIFLTAFADEMRIAQGYASGAVDYLPAPVVPEVLQAKVKVFVEMFQMRRQAALQAEEHAMRKAAEEAARHKDEFLGMLAHELRNPLGPICNAVQLLNMIGPKEPRLMELNDIIDRQAKHMARLIDDLLDATRLAHGKVLLRKERCNLSEIVRRTAEDYRHIFEANNLQLIIDVPLTPLWVNGDPTRLVQLVGNLLHNAHKFTNAGGHVTVRLEHEKSRHIGRISVSDTGIGIDAKVLPYVFDVFRQADQELDRSRGGLGLGLALVKGLTELHGGEVSASSNGLGEGAEFTLRLPLESAAAELPVTQTITIPEGEKYRILLIEDNQDTAESTRMLLNLEGYNVKTVGTGPAGLEAARQFHPQVVLCDIGLPGMDGYQIVRSIRQDESLASAYVIALTGYGRDQDQRQAFDAGFDLHLTKPIDYTSLRRTLAELPKRPTS